MHDEGVSKWRNDDIHHVDIASSCSQLECLGMFEVVIMGIREQRGLELIWQQEASHGAFWLSMLSRRPLNRTRADLERLVLGRHRAL